MVETKIKELLEESITKEGYILDEVTYGKQDGANRKKRTGN